MEIIPFPRPAGLVQCPPEMPRVCAVGTALPPHRAGQEAVAALWRRICAGDKDIEPYLEVFETSGVRERFFSFPLDYYASGRTFDERNADFVEQGAGLAAGAAGECLKKAGVKPEQVEHLFVVTTTGLACPGLDALLAGSLGLKEDVRRSPLFGLGCAGGVAALARAAEYVKGHPRHRALVVAVELCGQTFATRNVAPADVACAALYGDGAAAALVVGDEVPGTGPRLMGSRSVLLEGPEDLLGWTFTSDGMRPALSDGLAGFLEETVRRAVDDFILSWAMQRGKIRHWILPPGGSEVMEAYLGGFGLSESSVEPTRSLVANVGDLASASALFVLSGVMAGGRARPGDKGIMLAVGPGPAAEMILLGW